MRLRRFALITLAGLSLTACDNDDWADGTFIGTSTGGISNSTTLIVVNDARKGKSITFSGYTTCSAPAKISVSGSAMRVEPVKGVGMYTCNIDPFVLTRVDEATASTTVLGTMFEMKKQ